jgi:hypothetical protein
MASQQAIPLRITGLGKQKTAAFIARAKLLGMTPSGYLRYLVEEDLAVSERAKKSTFRELLGEGKKTDEAELDRLVEDAKIAYHRQRVGRV